MSSELAIGPAASGDVAALNIIYNGYIVGSHISFDVEPWTDAKRLEWLESRISNGYPVLVARRAGEVVGSAWAGSWQPKQAYRKSVETTIVLAPEIVGHGVGRTLYTAVLDELSTRGFHRAYAIIALPNEASVGLHRALAFREIGVFGEAGFKDGEFRSTMLLERALGN